MFPVQGPVPCRVSRVYISAVSAVSVSTMSAVSAVSGSACRSPAPCQLCLCQPCDSLQGGRLYGRLCSEIVLKIQYFQWRVLFHAVSPMSSFQPCQPCPCQLCQPRRPCLCQRVGLRAVSAMSVSAVSGFILCRVRVDRAARKSVSLFLLGRVVSMSVFGRVRASLRPPCLGSGASSQICMKYDIFSNSIELQNELWSLTPDLYHI